MMQMKVYDIAGCTMGKQTANTFINTYVSNINVAVVSTYLKNCIRPCKFDSGKTICLDIIKPAGKLIQNAMT